MKTPGTTKRAFDQASAEHAWRAFQRGIGVAPIYATRQFDQAVALMSCLVDVVGQNERHALAGLLDLVGELIASYESRVVPRLDACARDSD